MEVILDTNFIVSCIRKKIDFLEQLREQGFKVIVLREVLQELKDILRRDGSSREDRLAVNVALELLFGKRVKHMTIGQGKVDDELIRLGNMGYYIATLDRVIKRQVPSRVVIFDAQKRVGPE